MNLLSKLTPLLAVIFVLALVNFFMGRAELPTYGVWTGIRPIEEKIGKLEKFAKEGPVDALILGSSVADFGFSAELYSELMSEKLGRPYRVFNFSTGAAELVTIPTLYRIARTVVRPKAIFLINPVQFKRSEIISPNSPDYILNHAPIGAALENSIKLHLSKLVWTMPIVEKAAALRELVLFGRYQNLVGAGMDTYLVTAHGDRISYTAGQAEISHMSRLRRAYEDQIKPLKDISIQELTHIERYFFPSIDLKAMAELKDIARTDDLKIVVLAHSPAGALWKTPIENAEYEVGRAQYFNTLTKSVGGTLINPLDGLGIPDYAVMEDTHLNTHGAHIYTRAIFQTENSLGDGNPSRIDDFEQASLEPARAKESTFNAWSAIVLREQNVVSKSLKCRFVQSIAVPALPPSDLFFALRMPDGTDMIAPARQLSSGEYEANFELKKSDRKQALIFRLLYGAAKSPVNAPLASYIWTSSNNKLAH